MAYIKVRGVEHYYEWIKQTSAGSEKPVMVFIHGWAGSARYWQTTAEVLSEQFDCLLYDMRGFGRSRGKRIIADSQLLQQTEESLTELTYELEEYVEDLAVLLSELQLQRVYINAHSMGASIATLFLNQYQQRVEKAILTCSGIFEYDKKSFDAFHKFGGYVVKFRPQWLAKIPLVDRMFMARFLYRSIKASERQAFLEDFLIADYDAALNTIYTSVSKAQSELMPHEFAKLKVPSIIISGEYDKIIPADMGRKAATMSDQVEYVMIPNTAHFPMLEDPDTYLKTVKEFLQLPTLLSA
ncbi:MAG: alpha/beta hydrolase [Rivularia sp. (in: cyanobacteria)]